jgi:hypothetical protein
MTTLRCIKSLHKSTYKGLAFKNGKSYEVVTEDAHRPLPSEYTWLKDEHGNAFTFAKTPEPTLYFVEEYFQV